ncbi:MAG: hypothetical protein JSV25_08855 [Spirochaetota bacterium]|nr:MAG: hypothetical protein JSV25_08855 [Spirochaetota bacterium]
MKQTVQLMRIQEKMKPGIITRDGFLGTDRRNLIDILVEDDESVKRMDITHGEISQRMIDLRDAGIRGLGNFFSVQPHYEVKVDSVRGKLPCPFGDPGVFPKTNITVKNLKTGREITYTDFHIHMIGSHGFYEGKGSSFRLEPKDLVDILEVKKEEPD